MGVDKPGLVKLKCAVKNYDWGKVGEKSSVSRLYANNSRAEVDADSPYAEFWMGTHDSGPSYAAVPNGDSEERRDNGFKRENSNSVSLKDWIDRNPAVLGDRVLEKWGPNLPFLFKVLSVAKALSIQAHPDKELAVILHKQQPGVYKDDNHKPEMALALTEFEALCGFIGLEELKSVIQSVPEIVEIVGSSRADQVLQITENDGEKKLKEVFKSLFTDLISVSNSVISEIIPKLIRRLNSKRELTEKEELVLRLERQYPGDIGVIAAFLFNYVKLNPGEALYLGANEPHAYIHGECIECMATSDNVVRAGLTPKHRDVQTLCSMLTYKQGFPEILNGVPSNPYTVKYIPPFDEFEVDRCNLPEEASTIFPAVNGPSVFVVTSGEGTMGVASSKELVREGDVLFAPANSEITVETISGLNLYRAGVNSRFLEDSDTSKTY
ncbi:PREDICTED: mannose-6-phosphate isomerase 1-like isoform X2 [Erythranthe guttata]|uniref:mannose-6-phosphate isomerase 1-like isoform X2 n=1 Tax=Erythranthe guttata TaxID=4155 RepID=UPI00064D7D16|nr:PREDICTED: mannose-6-phosphate isomerase 1-like isoform X2 [Erythranthe guttata]|eukprot:XP_012854729.1 PREDICTED: mannose-6-phosphate isomerase 1-like isoform X2 [Erythranthe guttata]